MINLLKINNSFKKNSYKERVDCQPTATEV